MRVDHAVEAWPTGVATVASDRVGRLTCADIFCTPRIVEESGACCLQLGARLHHLVVEPGTGFGRVLEHRNGPIRIEQSKRTCKTTLGPYLSSRETCAR